ncbi:MAG: PaaI family thioesterase [Hyphomicrobiales bacterium]|nr:PaaI family thioesterase [Hyphomicrobiales bacterium]
MSDAGLALKLLQLNASAPFNRWAGFEIVSAEPGRVELRMEWKDDAAQYQGFLHAGLVGALIDTACGFAAFTQAGPVLASHFQVNCLAPAVGVVFHCKGEVLKAGKRQIFTRAELHAESKDGIRKLVATGETILMTT